MAIIDQTLERYHALGALIGPLNPKFGVEIGVRHGETSQYLLSHFPMMKKLFLVDPYLPYQDVYEYYDEKRQLETYKAAFERLTPFGKCVRWFINDYADAYTAIGHEVDFVFIDGLHTYEGVATDIGNYWPIIKKKGYLCGHDFNMDPVRKAVTEFADREKLDIVHFTDPNVDVWGIFKL